MQLAVNTSFYKKKNCIYWTKLQKKYCAKERNSFKLILYFNLQIIVLVENTEQH